MPKRRNRSLVILAKTTGKPLVTSFVQVMVLGIVGANMLYVLSPSSLKLLFPDDTNKRPYTSDGPSLFPKWTQQSGGGNGDADINSHVDSMTKKAKGSRFSQYNQTEQLLETKDGAGFMWIRRGSIIPIAHFQKPTSKRSLRLRLSLLLEIY